MKRFAETTRTTHAARDSAMSFVVTGCRHGFVCPILLTSCRTGVLLDIVDNINLTALWTGPAQAALACNERTFGVSLFSELIALSEDQGI